MKPKSTTVTIPASLEDARARLTMLLELIEDQEQHRATLNKLLGAEKWERAAIVATFVKLPGSGGDHRPGAVSKRDFSRLLTASEFAGLPGLKSEKTVRLYAKAWLDRFPRPEFGQEVELPYWCGECKADEQPCEGCTPWPPTRQGTNGFSSPEGAEQTVGRIIAEHGIDLVARAVSKTRKVPPPPSGGGPLPPSMELVARKVDIDRAQGNLHEAIGRVQRYLREAPELVDKPRLHRDRDYLITVVMEAEELLIERGNS